MKKKEQYRLRQESMQLKRFIMVCIILMLIVALPFAFVGWIKAPKLTTHQKALALGIRGASPEIEERHVQISEHPQVVGRNGDTTVHFMFRKNDQAEWGLCGTGGRLGKYTNLILTAYHVFEGRVGQFGFRKICKNEFTGKEKIYPIVSCQSQNADDAVLCTFDTNSSVFPVIAMPVSTNMFHEFVATNSYHSDVYLTTIHFSTYPEKKIQNLLKMSLTPTSHQLIFNWEVVHGESGTVASVDGMSDDDYLVIVREFKVPRAIWEQLTPANKKYFGEWSEDKLYALGNLIKVK